MSIRTPITVAYGDGIGPEIMDATLNVLSNAKAEIEINQIDIGKSIYLEGNTTGIPDSAWSVLDRTRVLLKSPITTPQGGGYKSLNVTLRKTLGLFANVRPNVAYAPYVATKFPKMDLVVIRENEEDLYSGIEYRQTDEVYHCLKIITREGSRKIIRYAFEYAMKFNRKRVTCFSKDNIMKMTDGSFHKIFDEIATEYPDIQHDHYIVDIGTALIATDPERFDVVVTSNLYGDIISDVAAQVAGSVGLAGSANIGNYMAMFEAIHGSAPDIAGKNIANPSGLIHAAIQMLVHINQPQTAAMIENAWLKTLEDGIHTADIYSTKHSTKKVGTKQFAEAVIDRLGEKPSHFKAINYQTGTYTKIECLNEPYHLETTKALVGVDIFLDNSEEKPLQDIVQKLETFENLLKLETVASRGLKIWPKSIIKHPYIRHLVCRFKATADEAITYQDVLELLEKVDLSGLQIIKTENLYTFDKENGYTLSQGQ